MGLGKGRGRGAWCVNPGGCARGGALQSCHSRGEEQAAARGAPEPLPAVSRSPEQRL